MNVLIIHCSYSGNTEELAHLISERFSDFVSCDIISMLRDDIPSQYDIERYDVVLIGSFTWGDGDIPRPAIEYLRQVIQLDMPLVAVFGTGDSVYPNFCGAVHKLGMNFAQVTDVIGSLAIELKPSDYDLTAIDDYIRRIEAHA